MRGGRSYGPKAVKVSNGTLDYTLPDDLSLGQYAVTVTLGGRGFHACDLLHVVPAPKWEVRLFPFDPEGSYEAETVWVPDRKVPKLKTARLSLRGRGFLTQRPQDNEIIINGQTQEVHWDGCTLPEPDPAHPSPNVIHGSVLSPERIELCRVPVPRDGTLRLAVKQGELTTEVQRFTVYRWGATPVAIAAGIGAGLLALVVVALIYRFISDQPKNGRYTPLKALFLDPETDTYSLSKLQFYLWTLAALFGYGYLVISRVLVQQQSWPDIPGTLPGIIAIGAGTSVGAQLVTNVRGPKGSGTENPSLGDFVTSGGVAAPERVQMLVWTLFGVGIFCLSVVQHPPGAIRELDPVPDGMLYLMGLSAVGYLGGKLARKPGPVINEISISPAESDEALSNAATPPPAPPPNIANAVAVAEASLAELKEVPAGSLAAVNALKEAVAAASETKTASDVGALVETLKEKRLTADAAAQTAAEGYLRSAATAGGARAAEIAQEAAAAVQELAAAVSAAVSLAKAPRLQEKGVLNFTRSVELRGRNLSSEGIIEIDGDELPFRMLRKNDQGHRAPEVVIREQEDPTLGRVLRLLIDPAELEGPDFQKYKRWFGMSSTGKKTFTIINPDGQKADLSFTVPPASAQSSVKRGQEVEAPATAAG
ncbi:hypothetical protein LPW11_21560 [Geomonas sp. RF6]|uniref:hypothetical protein n=1 Tax=Geomonas sp. RF6 TaxID=2897342 RepID=UPI001E2E7AEB|nr:hypothetical protein [Geomonas sp. RF6]UFS70443.1 hypothetical protein LPW11_21560 [Geomonas sp. RF6]